MLIGREPGLEGEISSKAESMTHREAQNTAHQPRVCGSNTASLDQ